MILWKKKNHVRMVYNLSLDHFFFLNQVRVCAGHTNLPMLCDESFMKLTSSHVFAEL